MNDKEIEKAYYEWRNYLEKIALVEKKDDRNLF